MAERANGRTNSSEHSLSFPPIVRSSVLSELLKTLVNQHPDPKITAREIERIHRHKEVSRRGKKGRKQTFEALFRGGNPFEAEVYSLMQHLVNTPDFTGKITYPYLPPSTAHFAMDWLLEGHPNVIVRKHGQEGVHAEYDGLMLIDDPIRGKILALIELKKCEVFSPLVRSKKAVEQGEKKREGFFEAINRKKAPLDEVIQESPELHALALGVVTAISRNKGFQRRLSQIESDVYSFGLTDKGYSRYVSQVRSNLWSKITLGGAYRRSSNQQSA